MTAATHMHREIREIPGAVDNLLTRGAGAMDTAAAAIRARDPLFFVSVARGSSDHAATYAKYVSEILTGLPVASVGPSVASVYGRTLKVDRAACLAISQSGKSPDIVRMVDMAGRQGALSVALTNNPDSDLARVAAHTLELHAGEELSVAATKTFVTSVVAGVWLMAELAQDAELLAAIRALPEALERAVQADWSALSDVLCETDSLYCLGRGPAFAMSNEAALKFKETCQVHGESYSSAEVLHGPVSIVDQGFPVIAMAAADAAEDAVIEVADQLAAKGAQVFATTGKATKAQVLPVVRTGHPLTDPIALIASFYGMVERTARARGINPDAPRHLRKVTETV